MNHPSQINLYNPEFANPRIPVSFRLLFQIIAIWLLLLILAGSGFSWYQAQLKNQAEQQSQKNKQAQNQLTELNQQLIARRKDSALVTRLDTLNERLAQREQMRKWLSQGGIPQTTGFSKALRTLAENPQSSIRLTQLEFTGEKRTLRIEGETFEADEVPRYLEKLSTTAAFQGQRFSELLIARPPTPKTSVANAAPPEPLPLLFSLIADTKTKSKTEAK